MFGFDNTKGDGSGDADNAGEVVAPQSTPPVPSTHSGDDSVPDEDSVTISSDADEPSKTMPALAPADEDEDDSDSEDNNSPRKINEDLLPNDHAKDDLAVIKQEALQKLSPLVSHLDQTPEEKFKTTMMMIQAADDHTHIATAFDAAKEITDDKVRAQALLDVINEINYFTQNQS